MFPSGNSYNPFEPLFKAYTTQDDDNHYQNPSSKLLDDENHNPSFLSSSPQFPSPFLEEENELPLNHIFSHLTRSQSDTLFVDTTNRAPKANSNNNNIQATEKASQNTSICNGATKVNSTAPGRKRHPAGTVPRRRAGKKDRHSKICTAQGIRDRRMRLSLQVARKFFDLQDMLGYDKASKTIEWLFSKSKNAIKDLAKDHPEVTKLRNWIPNDGRSDQSFVTECEEVSGIEENSNNELKEVTLEAKFSSPLLDTTPYETKKSRKGVSKSNTRESRDKARARARDRTREKLLIKCVENSTQQYELNPNEYNFEQSAGHFGSNHFEAVIEESNEDANNNNCHSLESLNVGMIEKLLGTDRSSSSPNNINEYQCFGINSDAMSSSGCVDSNNNFIGFLEHWDMINANNDDCGLTGNFPSYLSTLNFQFHQP